MCYEYLRVPIIFFIIVFGIPYYAYYSATD